MSHQIPFHKYFHQIQIGESASQTEPVRFSVLGKCVEEAVAEDAEEGMAHGCGNHAGSARLLQPSTSESLLKECKVTQCSVWAPLERLALYHWNMKI